MKPRICWGWAWVKAAWIFSFALADSRDSGSQRPQSSAAKDTQIRRQLLEDALAQ